MKRPSLEDVGRDYLDIYDWVSYYVKDQDESQGLTNQLHHLSSKRSKRAFVWGLGVGVFGILIILAYVL